MFEIEIIERKPRIHEVKHLDPSNELMIEASSSLIIALLAVILLHVGHSSPPPPRPRVYIYPFPES